MPCEWLQVALLQQQHLESALEELQARTSPPGDAAADPPAFASVATTVAAEAAASFRAAFAEDIRIEGSAWEGRSEAAAFDEELGTRIAQMRAERVSGAEPAKAGAPGVRAVTHTCQMAIVESLPGSSAWHDIKTRSVG